MLLIDGVRYYEWTDLKEIEDLEPLVVKHAKDIFGENMLYIDRKQKLKSLAGTSSIPDAYVIHLGGNSPHWHIVEIELSYKDPGRHLVTQINDFINGMRNSRNEIVSAINHWIKSDEIRVLEFKHRNKCEDIHEFLSEIINKDPILTIIIERNTEKLKEAIHIFEERYKTEIIEFRTFRRAGAETVHAYLFEPLYPPTPVGPIIITPPRASDIGTMEVTLRQDYISAFYVPIPKDKTASFPNSKTTLNLETNIGPMVIGFNPAPWGTRLQGGMKEWFRAHPELKVGDKVRISVVESMKKYRLEIVGSA